MKKSSPVSLTARQWRRISRQEGGYKKIESMVYNDVHHVECETDQEAAEELGKAAEVLARFSPLRVMEKQNWGARGQRRPLDLGEHHRDEVRRKLLHERRPRHFDKQGPWAARWVDIGLIPDWDELVKWLGEYIDAGWLRGSKMEPWPEQDSSWSSDGYHSLYPTNLGEYTDPKNVEDAEPTVGMKIGGQPLLYPGYENAIIGDTESGKTWFSIGCVAAEIRKGNHVAYMHFEEYNGRSTYERLIDVGLTREEITEHIWFLAPVLMPDRSTIRELIDEDPTLVILDGINEAMSLDKKATVDRTDGWARFRRKMVTPFTEDGAAVLMCDHVPKSGSPSGQAFGTIHKGNTMAGTRLLLTAKKGFGRGRQGESKLWLTKDRYGHLANLKPPEGAKGSKPGKALIGHLVVDGTPDAEEFLSIRKADHAKDALVAKSVAPSASVADNILAAFASVNGSGFPSFAALQKAMTDGGYATRRELLRAELAELVSQGVIERTERDRNRVEFRLK